MHAMSANENKSAGCGVVFKLDPTGTETVLYSFTGLADGAIPWQVWSGRIAQPLRHYGVWGALSVREP